MFQPTVQKLALLVRMDLGMSQGKIAAQCAHAALEAYLNANHGFKSRFTVSNWLWVGQPKIVLQVKDQEEIMSLFTQAKKAGLHVVAVKDAGKTQVKTGTVTVVGIGPNPVIEIDSIVQHLKLL